MGGGREEIKRACDSQADALLQEAVWLHAETLINRRVPFTDTSSRISGMEVAVKVAKSARQDSRQPTSLCH